MRFVRAEYWDLSARFTPTTGEGKGKEFEARLTTLGGKRIASGKDFDPDTGKLKRDDVELLTAASAKGSRRSWRPASSSSRPRRSPSRRAPRRPSRPRRCSRGATASCASTPSARARGQQLYENGFIPTCGRTPSRCRRAIGDPRGDHRDLGAEFVPDEPRLYKGKSQNAQEAHEAIARRRGDRARVRDPQGPRRGRGEVYEASGCAPSRAR